MTRRITPWLSLAALSGMLAVGGEALAQGPTLPESSLGRNPGSEGPTLGPIPGAGENSLGTPPGASGSLLGAAPAQEVLGGRPGASVPRVPTSATQTPGGAAGAESGPARPVAPLAEMEIPEYGLLKLPEGPEDEGPPDGMTLDQAIDRLVHENLDLRSKFFEIPQADADILTASLRANPLLYADSQLIPYSQYSRQRPGGPLQYDLNITWPIDWNGKRQARTEVAVRAKRVLDARYQDAVRLQIDNLYTAWVNVLEARQLVRAAEAGVEGLRELEPRARAMSTSGATFGAEYNRVVIQLESAELSLHDNRQALNKNLRTFGALLNVPPTEALQLKVRGTIRNTAPAPPPLPELVQIAMDSRPDLVAYRLGVQRAAADVRLAVKNRYQNIYLLVQPYTFQNNEPFGSKSATSWAMGITVPLPVFDRNQGNIRRAELNVSQTRTELSHVERQAITEVELAATEYETSLEAVRRITGNLMPRAQESLALWRKQFEIGQRNPILFLGDIQEFNTVVRQALSALIRHRRAMLDLNTAVGRRVLP